MSNTYDEDVVGYAITALMPKIDDNRYDKEIEQAFRVLLGLIHSSFMGIDIKQHSDDCFPNNLDEAFVGYNRRLTDEKYQFRAFIASLYELNPLDVNAVSPEWQWLAKLCHLLVYFAGINVNHNRIEDICRVARLWHKPSHGQHKLWYVCHQDLQAKTLLATYQNTSKYLNQLNNSETNKTTINQFCILHRIIAFAYKQQKKDKPSIW